MGRGVRVARRVHGLGGGRGGLFARPGVGGRGWAGQVARGGGGVQRPHSNHLTAGLNAGLNAGATARANAMDVDPAAWAADGAPSAGATTAESSAAIAASGGGWHGGDWHRGQLRAGGVRPRARGAVGLGGRGGTAGGRPGLARRRAPRSARPGRNRWPGHAVRTAYTAPFGGGDDEPYMPAAGSKHVLRRPLKQAIKIASALKARLTA